ncbi:twin-arginine translocation pathway signal protein [Vibrio sp. 404]|uniref:Twin-arginine translocation pathway signal protein n=2 Tax=Vibrio marinisediminis TaxID=2758441 RepID=A0A7W2FUH0_9VIBR|nr:twin-arginine translocation pathway signal protein [Vibrio marinisediminis]
MGTGAVIVAASPLVITQLSDEKPVILRPLHDYQDIRKTLISYAMLCPNPHNKQPWKVSLSKSNVIRIFVDEERLLPETDPYHRQIHIGIGCFVDSLIIAAKHFSMRPQINYFPQGEYDNLSLEPLPVVDITLDVVKATVGEDLHGETLPNETLFRELSRRQTTKIPYSPTMLPDSVLANLSHLVTDQQHYIKFISDHKDKTKMASYLVDAITIEESNKYRSLETINMFRFTNEEFAKYRDGFGLEQNGVSGIKKWIAETMFISREKAERDPTSFGQQGINKVKEVVADNPHYALLVTKENSRQTQIKIGEIYNRINLTCSHLGVAMHPMSQILEEYDDMRSLQTTFKQHFQIETNDTVQMLFRLGKAPATAMTPRREVKSILV